MMQIENNGSIEVCGSSLSGYVNSTYDELVAVFGEPTFTDCDPREKVQCEWVLRIGDVVATIYNWKTGSVPLDVYDWHVGGFGRGEVDVVHLAIEEHWRRRSREEKKTVAMSDTDYPRDHAFPCGHEQPGITKRELYAAHALVGFLASGRRMNGTEQGGAEDAALFCWRMADAMISTADDPPTTERADDYRTNKHKKPSD